MKNLEFAKHFIMDEEGLTVVEYVIGAALLVLALVGVFAALRDGLSSSLSDTLGNLPDTLDG
ncbi:Flp family type IVb pilin [Vibrio breoganii]